MLLNARSAKAHQKPTGGKQDILDLLLFFSILILCNLIPVTKAARTEIQRGEGGRRGLVCMQKEGHLVLFLLELNYMSSFSNHEYGPLIIS